jgi:DNA anti-recombination protein RmuC
MNTSGFSYPQNQLVLPQQDNNDWGLSGLLEENKLAEKRSFFEQYKHEYEVLLSQLSDSISEMEEQLHKLSQIYQHNLKEYFESLETTFKQDVTQFEGQLGSMHTEVGCARKIHTYLNEFRSQFEGIFDEANEPQITDSNNHRNLHGQMDIFAMPAGNSNNPPDAKKTDLVE